MVTITGHTTRNLTLAFPCFSQPPTMMQVRCKEVGRRDFVFLAVCFDGSDEEITHERKRVMICDVHFGDTRYD